jgi:hypothetical protein
MSTDEPQRVPAGRSTFPLGESPRDDSHQQAVIEYLKTEGEILKFQLDGRRPKLTEGDRRMLATNVKAPYLLGKQEEDIEKRRGLNQAFGQHRHARNGLFRQCYWALK